MAATSYTRSSNLSDRQRDFLAKYYTIDLAIQRLIPSSTVSPTLTISSPTIGVLLTHQPLITRFYGEFLSIQRLLNPSARHSPIVIYASGYDYDLTHSLYYVPSPRSLPTSQLTAEGVELSGIYSFDRAELAVFLEDLAATELTTGKVGYHKGLYQWLRLLAPGRQHVQPPMGLLDGLEADQVLRCLRMQWSLRLWSRAEVWRGYLGMDWPEYFLGTGAGWRE